MRGETVYNSKLKILIRISIHSPHARGDKNHRDKESSLLYFNPLPSCEGRPNTKQPTKTTMTFQSTPLMRGETETA